jgi:hypothetical protein
MTNHVTERYIKECLAEGSQLRYAVRDAQFPARYFDCFGDRLMARPFFIEEAETLRAAADLTELFHIILGLPDRLFDGDLRSYCDTLGFSSRQLSLMRRIGNRPPELFGRSDLYHDGTGLKLLEFNVGSQLGGIDQSQVMPALLEVDAFREFAEDQQLGYVHTGERIAASLRAAALPVTEGREPVVALVEADGALQSLMPLMLSFEEMFRGRGGLDLRLAEVSQLSYRDGKLWMDKTPIDAVLRYFSINQIIADPHGEEAVAPIYRAHEEGGTVLLTTMESLLYANKGCLALLSDPRWRDAFTPAEVEMFDRVLPWTRLLTADLVDQCRANRAELILKPCNDHGGRGITVGWDSTDREWASALSSALAGRYIVQERVHQRLEPVVNPETGAVEDWIACWSTFLTTEGYAGSHIRALPSHHSGIINRGHNPATRLTGVFHYAAESTQGSGFNNCSV